MSTELYLDSKVRFSLTKSGKLIALKNLGDKKKVLITLSQNAPLEESAILEKDLSYVYKLEYDIKNEEKITISFSDFISIFGTINPIFFIGGGIIIL